MVEDDSHISGPKKGVVDRKLRASCRLSAPNVQILNLGEDFLCVAPSFEAGRKLSVQGIRGSITILEKSAVCGCIRSPVIHFRVQENFDKRDDL
jgi:hypothetical protein